jgi:hypothetical protein
MSDPRTTTNATGFAFQLAVEEVVRAGKEEHGWVIASREHGWRDGDTPRFIDLVLTRGQIHLVIECKRQRAGQWVFLVPDPPEGRRAEQRRWFRTNYLRNEDSSDGREAVASLANFQLEPSSWESSFCAVRGASESDRPMLDRVCAELTRSTDAVIRQQLSVDGRRNKFNRIDIPDGRSWLAVPVIVTAAELHVCRFDPAIVPLIDGVIPDGAATFEKVPSVRYRKSFDVETSNSAQNISELERHAQRTVSIVTATHLAEWLQSLNLERASYGG